MNRRFKTKPEVDLGTMVMKTKPALACLPDIAINSQVGVIGGSFNPPHLGHQLLALSFLALEPIEQLWIIPCESHAFKGDVSDFKHRLAMCKLAFQRINKVQVLDIERHLKKPNFTILTIDAIKSARPDLSIVFGLGSDLVTDFAKWHRAQELVSKTQVVIFERESYPIKQLPPILKSARFHEGYVLPNMNSTELRQRLHQVGGSPMDAFLDRDVARYISDNQLYRGVAEN